MNEHRAGDRALNRPVLERDAYLAPAEEVARRLLGTVIVRTTDDGVAALRLNEVEAYLGIDDPAAHTYGGRRTQRTETMWGPPGHAYIYLIYGLHHCLNAVAGPAGTPAAVLIRGGVPVEGHEIIRARRGEKVRAMDLTNGPGKLCQALALTRAEDSSDLCDRNSGLYIVDDGVDVPDAEVKRTPRIGIDYAGEAATWPLRFVWRGDEG